jgi:polysaccharide pyruvyl transferase WcaK-like protein
MKNMLADYKARIITFIRKVFMRINTKLFRNKNYINITHVTYFASSNVGDTVLSDTVRNTFGKQIGKINWNLSEVSDEVSNKSINSINKSKAVVIGGGGLFLPDTNKNAISGWQWSCGKEQLDRISNPIILFAVGYNYFRGQEANQLFINSLNHIIQKSVFIGLRNHGSIKEVEKLIHPELRKKIVHQPCTTTIIRKLNYKLPAKQITKKVAFNVAFDRVDLRFGNKKEVILSQIAKSVKLIEGQGYELCYIAHCVKDLDFVSYLNSEGLKIAVINASSWATDKLITFYNGVDVVIGMRGHAQMIPFGVNCHIITLGSHEKMKWFLEDIDALDWYVELTNNCNNLANTIFNKFIEIHEIKGEETTKRILDAQEKLHNITLQNMEYIKGKVFNEGEDKR